ncbi:SDR family oxidoreductase [Acidocella sp.]|uniref:SDR family oxidoreductase n=1 Tax=Acidocella sp. TaxID=50710 RepID=UPI00261FDB31|nr:SDR family oxidoreductase [Acidocella sp.]
MASLDYKVAIVTCCTSDFGRIAATALAEAGATLLLTGMADTEGEALAAALRGQGRSASYQHLDTGDAMAWAVLADTIMRTHGHLDILVNNTSNCASLTIEGATAAQLRDVLEAGLIAPFLGMKAVIPAMRQSGGGAIINIAANPIAEVLPLYALDSSAKAGLTGLTKSTAVHCSHRGYGIRVNTVHPGAHETALLTTNALRSLEAEALHPMLATLPRRPQAPLQELGAAIAFLASDAAAGITGAEIHTLGPLAGLGFTQAAP